MGLLKIVTILSSSR